MTMQDFISRLRVSSSPRLRVLLLLFLAILTSTASADTLDRVRERGELVWGGDAEGGGPYVYPDPADPDQVVGFEVELAAALAKELGVKPRFFQGPWDNLPSLLNTRQIDIVLNGYELTGSRLGLMDATHPYYIYELVLLGRRDNPQLRTWEDLKRKSAGRKLKVAALSSSGAYNYLIENYADDIDIVSYDANTDGMRDVETGKLDASVVDLPIATFYRDRFPELQMLGEPTGRGYYTIYVRQDRDDQGRNRLRDELNQAIVNLLQSGQLQAIYERYGLWTTTQDQLLKLAGQSSDELGIKATRQGGWQVIRQRGRILLQSAAVTVFLACVSMPLAIAIGLLVALGRLYGPVPLRWPLVCYVEVLRGTPLMLQLFVIFYLLPEIGINIQAIYAAILGLAINYSAYEAEIYRAGLQAIPRGQMEAALALGMSQSLALRRIIVPQAVRIVVPPVTNDFIAMFKDTSVCSVITVVELTKQYSIQRNDTGATVELAAMTAILYLMMSVPLAHLTSRMEKRMRKQS